MASVAGTMVAGVVLTAATIQGAVTEDAYFKASVRLWVLIGGVISMMSLALAPAVSMMGDYPGSAKTLYLGLFSVPAVVAVGACFVNAWALHRVRRRRSDALAHGDEIDAVVVARDPKPFAHDILSITLEATLRHEGGPSESVGGYRAAAPEPTQRVTFVETCPGDQWCRLEPGSTVRMRVDPSDRSRYALVLFDAA